MDSETLKELRKSLGYSIASAAELVHVTARTWSRYEAGDKPVPEGVVHLFCLLNKLKYPYE